MNAPALSAVARVPAAAVAAVPAARGWVRRRAPMLGIRTAKTTGAAVAAFAAARAITGSAAPLLAPLTALLVVQVTFWSTLRSSVDRVASVVAGVLLAVAFSAVAGLSWWSLGTLVFLSLVVGWLLRLGDNLLEVPISAMLVLGVYDPSVAAWDRVQATLIGAGVGVLATVLAPPPVYSAPAGRAVRRLAGEIALVLERAGADLIGGWSAERSRRSLDVLRGLRRDVAAAERSLEQLRESMRLNPRARRLNETPGSLQAALTVLELTLVSLPAVFRVLSEGVDRPAREPAFGPQVRGELAAVLLLCGEAIDVFGEYTATDVTAPTSGESRLADAVARAREARERLGAAMLAHPHTEMSVWGLRGALTLALDRVLDELDLERTHAALGVRRSVRPAVMRGLVAHEEAERAVARRELRRSIRQRAVALRRERATPPRRRPGRRTRQR